MERKIGAVEGLCKEIEFPFIKAYECPEVLVSFVAVLVAEIADRRAMEEKIAPVTGYLPTNDSLQFLGMVEVMLKSRIDLMIGLAAEIHDHHAMNGFEEAEPCDLLVELFSSCTSAIRFGLEDSCRSRHTAQAAQDVWKYKYGLRLFDLNTSKWEKDWARTIFVQALACLLFPSKPQQEN